MAPLSLQYTVLLRDGQEFEHSSNSYRSPQILDGLVKQQCGVRLWRCLDVLQFIDAKTFQSRCERSKTPFRV